jgi:hypothetical protein
MSVGNSSGNNPESKKEYYKARDQQRCVVGVGINKEVLVEVWVW